MYSEELEGIFGLISSIAACFLLKWYIVWDFVPPIFHPYTCSPGTTYGQNRACTCTGQVNCEYDNASSQSDSVFQRRFSDCPTICSKSSSLQATAWRMGDIPLLHLLFFSLSIRFFFTKPFFCISRLQSFYETETSIFSLHQENNL